MITMSLVCAVFSPVWAEWQQTEKQRHDGRPVDAVDKNLV
jgi:hypothetical protein